MTDQFIKSLTENLEAPTFDMVAFQSPPTLSEATVAIVTSASLHHPGQEDFTPTDIGFRILDGKRRDYILGHWSPNFDTMGFASDFNTVFPLDRLDELAAEGKIGKVSDTHLSYAGNQLDLSGIRMDSGPAGAKLLKDKGVDIVLFTPV
jgi:D-proline reductase (dithiol) PrdB